MFVSTIQCEEKRPFCVRGFQSVWSMAVRPSQERRIRVSWVFQSRWSICRECTYTYTHVHSIVAIASSSLPAFGGAWRRGYCCMRSLSASAPRLVPTTAALCCTARGHAHYNTKFSRRKISWSEVKSRNSQKYCAMTIWSYRAYRDLRHELDPFYFTLLESNRLHLLSGESTLLDCATDACTHVPVVSNRSCWISWRYAVGLWRIDCSTVKLSNSVKPLFWSPEGFLGSTDPVAWNLERYLCRLLTHKQYFSYFL